MEAYDHEVLDRTAHEIVDTAQAPGAVVHGPIPLPTRIERYTVLRSPHIDRKSREQFEIRTHKRLIDILQPTGKTIEALNKGLSLPPGVDIKIRVVPASSRERRPRGPRTEGIRHPSGRFFTVRIPSLFPHWCRSGSPNPRVTTCGFETLGRVCVVSTAETPASSPLTLNVYNRQGESV